MWRKRGCWLLLKFLDTSIISPAIIFPFAFSLLISRSARVKYTFG